MLPDIIQFSIPAFAGARKLHLEAMRSLSRKDLQEFIARVLCGVAGRCCSSQLLQLSGSNMSADMTTWREGSRLQNEGEATSIAEERMLSTMCWTPRCRSLVGPVLVQCKWTPMCPTDLGQLQYRTSQARSDTPGATARHGSRRRVDSGSARTYAEVKKPTGASHRTLSKRTT